ncbi:hypothetical protein SLA2020_235720 [Shorea laevis]
MIRGYRPNHTIDAMVVAYLISSLIIEQDRQPIMSAKPELTLQSWRVNPDTLTIIRSPDNTSSTSTLFHSGTHHIIVSLNPHSSAQAQKTFRINIDYNE